MTTEDDLQAVLDSEPGNHHQREILADFLQDSDDLRAEGYRALGVVRRRAVHHAGKWFIGNGDDRGIRDWLGMDLSDRKPYSLKAERDALAHSMLPRDWFLLVRVCRVSRDPADAGRHDAWTRFATRREAEDAAALAFAKLPAERRAELLATQPAEVPAT